jgi:hypothetical protein
MAQASTTTTDKARELLSRYAIDDDPGTLNGFELALGQSSDISGGTDVTESTTTSYTEISSTGSYAAKSLTPGSDLNVTLSGGTVKIVVSSKTFTPSGADYDTFDQVLLVMDVDGTKYPVVQWPDGPRDIVDGQDYTTGDAETEIA